MTEKINATAAGDTNDLRVLIKKLVTGLSWRWTQVYNTSLFKLATWRRSRVTRPTFVAVTGSVGKTTAKELISQILTYTFGAGIKTPESLNYPEDLARVLINIRDSDAFCIAEISAHAGPGGLDVPLALLKPRVGVVTAIGLDHHSAYGDIAAIAKEKSKVIQCLPRGGIAVLNCDDPNVITMGTDFPGTVVTFGVSEDAIVRASSIRSVWPDRLSLDVTCKGESVSLQTQLCGTHWVPSILAALATGVALGVPLMKAAEALTNAKPFDGRMEPVVANGITFILDDWKSALPSIEPALEVMRTARGSRKVIVIGNISDYPGSDRRYAQIARSALEIADCVVFVGQYASIALRAKRNPNDNLYFFPTTLDAHNFLNAYLTAGDLVLLKGNIRTDHLRRLYLARTESVKCWRMDCRRAIFCDSCELINVPSGAAASPVENTIAIARKAPQTLFDTAGTTVVIGLGNPQTNLTNTPHNVGYRAVDEMANIIRQVWSTEGDIALTMRGTIEDQPLLLVKPLCEMNESGPAIAQLANRLNFSIDQCIIVHDDMELSLGTVRARERGSDGGHKGVKSILQVFQTDQVKRVKIGVGKPRDSMTVTEYVIAPFPEAERPKIELAIKLAKDRALELIRKQIRDTATL